MLLILHEFFSQEETDVPVFNAGSLRYIGDVGLFHLMHVTYDF